MILLVIQARYSSTRLRGKVLKKIINIPMILLLIYRIQNLKNVDNLIVATSNDYTDKKIINLCKKYKINFHSGDLNNVLKRFYDVAKIYKPDHIVRITADCPLLYGSIIDNVIKIHLNNNNDYTSNRGKKSNVDGLDVEVFKSKLLTKSYLYAKSKYDKEHVTSYMYNKLKNIKKQYIDSNFRLSKYKLSVDDKKDFDLITKIFNKYKSKYSIFNANDIYNFLKKDFR